MIPDTYLNGSGRLIGQQDKTSPIGPNLDPVASNGFLDRSRGSADIVSIVDPTLELVDKIVEDLRPIDMIEAALFTGMLPEVAVCESVLTSKICKVALVNNEPCCIFGIRSTDTGVHIPWMVGTTLMDIQPPIRIIAKANEFMSLYKDLHLVNYIMSDNIKSIRFLVSLGFLLGPDIDYQGFKIKRFERLPMNKTELSGEL
jgi:hypothetical protein